MTSLQQYTRSLLCRLPAHGREGEGDEGVDRIHGCTAGSLCYLKWAQGCDKGHGGKIGPIVLWLLHVYICSPGGNANCYAPFLGTPCMIERLNRIDVFSGPGQLLTTGVSAWTDGTVLGVVLRLVFLDAMICSHTYPLSLIEMLVLLLCREYFVHAQE